MKSAGKARNNGLYRHIRTSKEIIRNLLNDLHTYKIKKNDINRIYRLNKLISKQSMNPNEILNNFPSNNQSHY